jgi:hypothetical protein
MNDGEVAKIMQDAKVKAEAQQLVSALQQAGFLRSEHRGQQPVHSDKGEKGA